MRGSCRSIECLRRPPVQRVSRSRSSRRTCRALMTQITKGARFEARKNSLRSNVIASSSFRCRWTSTRGPTFPARGSCPEFDAATSARRVTRTRRDTRPPVERSRGSFARRANIREAPNVPQRFMHVLEQTRHLLTVRTKLRRRREKRKRKRQRKERGHGMARAEGRVMYL